MAEFKRPVNKKTVPCCPNHGEPLEGMGHPMPAKGVGYCPVSKVEFEYSIQIEEGSTEFVKDHNGNITPMPTIKVTGEEDGYVKES